MTALSRPIHQVFINFRGTDLRYGFASHLIDALERHNIKFFIDTHEQKGRDMKHLFKRIEEATVALVILSARSEAEFIKDVVKEVENVLNAILSDDEGREEDTVKNIKKMKTYHINPCLALPWLLFGTAVLFGFGLLADIVHKCSSPAMVSLVGQVGSVVASSSCFLSELHDCIKRIFVLIGF